MDHNKGMEDQWEEEDKCTVSVVESHSSSSTCICDAAKWEAWNKSREEVGCEIK